MKGRKDFTTKKGHKYYNRRGHRQTRNAKEREEGDPTELVRVVTPRKGQQVSQYESGAETSPPRKDYKYYNRSGHRPVPKLTGIPRKAI